MLPIDNILFLQSKNKFSAQIKYGEKTIKHEDSIQTNKGDHVIIFLPQQDIEMNLKYYLHLNFHEEKKSVLKIPI